MVEVLIGPIISMVTFILLVKIIVFIIALIVTAKDIYLKWSIDKEIKESFKKHKI